MIEELLAPWMEQPGIRVLDVGAGDGSLVRSMAAQGADVVGVECGEVMLAGIALSDRQRFAAGVGEALPIASDSFDLVLFSYSLHHVPVPRIHRALREAHRVLRAGGELIVVEPIADDPDNMAAFPVIDERPEQSAVQELLARADEFGFHPVRRSVEESEGVYESLEAWLELIVGVDPGRAHAVEEHRDRLTAQFYELGSRRADGWVFARRNNVAVLVSV